MSDLGHQSPQTILVQKMGKIPVTETLMLNTFTYGLIWKCKLTIPPNGKMTMDLCKIYEGEEKQHNKIYAWRKVSFCGFFFETVLWCNFACSTLHNLYI